MSTCLKSKSSKGHRGQRRANWKMGMTNPAKCSKCGEFVMPHCIRKNCGTYNRKEITKAID